MLVIFLVNVVRNPELPEILARRYAWRWPACDSRPPEAESPFAPARKRKIAALGKDSAELRAAARCILRGRRFQQPRVASIALSRLDLLLPGALHAVSADGHLDVDQDPKLLNFLAVASKRKGVDLASDVHGQQLRPVKGWCPPESLANAGKSRCRENLVKSARGISRMPSMNPGLWWISNPLPKNKQGEFSELSSTTCARGSARANLKLMVALPAADWSYDYKYFALASRCDHPDELRLSLAHFAAGSHRAAGLVRAQHRQHREDRAAGQDGDGHCELRLRLAGENEEQSAIPWRRPSRSSKGVKTAVESESDIASIPIRCNLHYSYEDEHNLSTTSGCSTASPPTTNCAPPSARACKARRCGAWAWKIRRIWDIWDATRPDDAIRKKLEDVPPGYDLILEGDGDIWRITATPQSGRRTFEYDADYRSRSTMKASRAIRFPGASSKWAPRRKKVALTFDDGPDPAVDAENSGYPESRNMLPRTFFVIGESANQETDTREARIRCSAMKSATTRSRIPISTRLSKSELQFELNLTELLLESSLGVKTTLFRPPYGIDHQPETASEIQMLPDPAGDGLHDCRRANRSARLGRAERRRSRRPPTRSCSACSRTPKPNKGNIILMHDGGGDRSHTVAALPRIIDGLRAKGYQFVSVSDSAGADARASDAFRSATHEWLLVRADAFIFDAVPHGFAAGLRFIFIAGILLVSGRALMIGLLAIGRKIPACAAGSSRIISRRSAF